MASLKLIHEIKVMDTRESYGGRSRSVIIPAEESQYLGVRHNSVPPKIQTDMYMTRRRNMLLDCKDVGIKYP